MAQFKSIKSNRYVSLRKFDRWSLFWPVSIQSETNRTTRWRQANQVANEAFSGSVATLLIRRLINSEKMVSHRHHTADVFQGETIRQLLNPIDFVFQQNPKNRDFFRENPGSSLAAIFVLFRPAAHFAFPFSARLIYFIQSTHSIRLNGRRHLSAVSDFFLRFFF